MSEIKEDQVMPEVNEYAPGTFCWPELTTTDGAGAKKFYSELFGWTPQDRPAGPDMVYTMLQHKDKEVGAMCEMDAQRRSQGVPPHWLSYVSVKDADQAVESAQKLGGAVLMPAFDVFDVGRMAYVQDPTGAAFAVWQPKKHIGATLVNEPGALCWNELVTTDTNAARQFYTGLFGWTAEEQQMGPMTYTIYQNGGQPAGGMFERPEEWGPVPPNWIVYFAVDDCDKTAEKAQSIGATIVSPPSDIPDIGRFAIIQDPQGAVFAIIKLAHS
jgi:predicted enzyme related to lactoylglutathione lyase